jgi:hypothetical protein
MKPIGSKPISMGPIEIKPNVCIISAFEQITDLKLSATKPFGIKSIAGLNLSELNLLLV